MWLFAAAIAFLIVTSGAPQAATRNGEMDFVFEQHDFRWMDMGLRQTVYAAGVITPGTAARLNAFLDANKAIPGSTISFDSPGGNLQEGLKLGRLIRQRNLQTNVNRKLAGPATGKSEGVCYSACSIAFLGGTIRYVAEETSYGVHRFAIPDNRLSGSEALEAAQVQSSQVAEYVHFMGIDSDFITEMNRASPASMNVLSQARLRALRIITPNRETKWELRTTQTGEVYFAGETKDIRGLHKILFVCPTTGNRTPFMQLMFNAGQGSDIVATTKQTNLRVNESDISLTKTELVKGPFVENYYVSSFVVLSPRLLKLIQGANSLGVSMIHRAGVTYAGFDAVFVENKDKVMAYLRPCMSSR